MLPLPRRYTSSLPKEGEEETEDSGLERMLRLLGNGMMGAADEDGSSDDEVTTAATEDISSDEKASDGEEGEAEGNPATAGEDRQSAYLSLGARPKTWPDKK